MHARLAAVLSGIMLATLSLPAVADVLISVDKGTQTMSVAVDGVERYSWPVSTGKAGHITPDASARPQRMEREHFSKEWDDAPMPFSIFFTDKGHAIHGSGHVAQLGNPASHGCVRLQVSNAETLFELVKSQGINRTRIVVEGETPAPAPRVATRRSQPQAQRQVARSRYQSDFVDDEIYAEDVQMRRSPPPAYVPYPYEDDYRPSRRRRDAVWGYDNTY